MQSLKLNTKRDNELLTLSNKYSQLHPKTKINLVKAFCLPYSNLFSQIIPFIYRHNWEIRNIHMNHVNLFLKFNTNSTNHCLSEKFLAYLNPKLRWVIAKLNFYHHIKITNLSICHQLLLMQIEQHPDNSDNLATEYKYCFDTSLLSKYFHPLNCELPETKKKWNQIIHLHTEFQWATQINKELFSLLNKNEAPSKHLWSLNFIHLNKKPFRLPEPVNKYCNISENHLHQLRLIIIRNHPNISIQKCLFCNFQSKNTDIHLLISCPKLKMAFLAYWKQSYNSLLLQINTSKNSKTHPLVFLKTIRDFVTNTLPTQTLILQMIHLIFTADTFIDQKYYNSASNSQISPPTLQLP